MAKKMRFEDALKRLEEILGFLEQGDKSLDESLKLFEEGTKLVRFCSKRLEEAKGKIEILKRGENGKLKPEPFKIEVKEPEQSQTKRDEDEQLFL
jgi:exodeoxyribonuclease VII small subunit